MNNKTANWTSSNDYCNVTHVSYALHEQDKKNIEFARKILSKDSVIYCITIELTGDVQVFAGEEEFRLWGTYIEVFNTGGCYITAFEKHTNEKITIPIELS